MLRLEGFYGQTIEIPEDLMYFKDQELWVKPWQISNSLCFGFTQVAVALVSGFTYMEFIAEVGGRLDAGRVILAVDTYKVSLEVASPVAGEVVYLNRALEGDAVAALETACYAHEIFALRVSPDFEIGREFIDAKSYMEAVEEGETSLCGR